MRQGLIKNKQPKKLQTQTNTIIVQQEPIQKRLKTLINQGIIKVENLLQNGELSIEKKRKVEITKVDKFQSKRSELQLVKRQIQTTTDQYAKKKKQILTYKKLLKEEQKQRNQLRIKEAEENIRKWKEQQQQIKEKRQKLQNVKKNQQMQQIQKAQRQIQEQIQFKKLQKKKIIERRLQQIEQNKLKREELLKHSHSQIKTLSPMFLMMEKRFKEHEYQAKFEEEIQRKNHQISLKIDHEALKSHQKAFLQKISQRKSLDKQANLTNDQKPEFKLLLSKDEAKIQMEKQKIKRRKQFQQKLKQIPIVIDEAKKVRVQIQIDKGKNRKKYNFLRQKALNDFQIYGQFRQFQLNVNAKEIGNQYLKQLPEIVKSSRVTKSRSLNTLIQKEKHQRVKFKDYLQELKTQRQSRVSSTDYEINKIMRNFKQKQKALQQLGEKIKIYDMQTKRKKQDLLKSNGLRNSLHKTQQIDDLYLKSIKTKLACLDINQ